MNVDLSNIKTYDAIGCKHCNNTGYYDRIGVFEVLDLDCLLYTSPSPRD